MKRIKNQSGRQKWPKAWTPPAHPTKLQSKGKPKGDKDPEGAKTATKWKEAKGEEWRQAYEGQASRRSWKLGRTRKDAKENKGPNRAELRKLRNKWRWAKGGKRNMRYKRNKRYKRKQRDKEDKAQSWKFQGETQKQGHTLVKARGFLG